MSDLTATPYHSYFEAAMGPEGHFDDWSGYAAAMVVTSIEEEALAVRTAATALDLSAMNKYKITGKQAGAMLDYMMTRKVSSMLNNRVAYVIWVNENGKLIDDGTVFKFSDEEYIIKCGEDQDAWLDKLASNFNVNIANMTTEAAGLSIQGAKSYALLVASGAKNLENLKAFQMTNDTIGGEAVYISRTGFSGDLGYEIWSTADQVATIWQTISSTDVKLTPMGLTALDVLRTECGYIIPGYDFGLADTDVVDFERSPHEMALDWMVDLKREDDFVGKAAIQAELENNSSEHQFVAVELDDKSDTGAGSLYETALYNAAGEEIGLITSGGYSSGLQKNIGLASIRISNDASVGAVVYVGDDKMKAQVAKLPFFTTERRTLTPPSS